MVSNWLKRGMFSGMKSGMFSEVKSTTFHRKVSGKIQWGENGISLGGLTEIPENVVYFEIST
jgi:hypothetical protein